MAPWQHDVMPEARATSFGSVAAAYERGRPDYQAEAVRWLLGAEPRVVLDLGAGTGKLTRAVLREGHEVIAVDPDARMLAELSAGSPTVPTRVGSAEATGLASGSVDAVVLGQAWHWVDPEPAAREIARILRPGGVLGLVWNIRDARSPFVADLSRLMHTSAAEALIEGSGPTVPAPFGPCEHATFDFTRTLSPGEIVDMVASRSYVVTAPEQERRAVIASVRELVATHPEGRGRDRIDVPYRTQCFRTQVDARRDLADTQRGEVSSR